MRDFMNFAPFFEFLKDLSWYFQKLRWRMSSDAQITKIAWFLIIFEQKSDVKSLKFDRNTMKMAENVIHSLIKMKFWTVRRHFRSFFFYKIDILGAEFLKNTDIFQPKYVFSAKISQESRKNTILWMLFFKSCIQKRK